MKKITLLFCLLLASVGFAQQSGYYVTTGGQRVDGQFMETDFLNANTLKFKSGSAGDFTLLDTKDVKEYGVGTDYKSVKYTVQIDVTDAAQGQLSANKDATWQKQTLFLNVLVEGDATLYSYTTDKGTKFFYKIESKQLEPQQLLYRQYTSGSLTSAENNKFRQQLYTDLNCNDSNKMDKFIDLDYRKAELVTLFEEYNTCKNSQNVVYKNNTGKKTHVLYSVFAGLYNGKFNIEGINPEVADDKYLSFAAGAEIAMMFPSDKFALFFRAEYESMKSELVNVYTTPYGSTITQNNFKLKGGLFNLYFGPRYYFNLNDKNRLFIDGAVVAAFPTGDLTQSTTINYDSGTTIDNVTVNKLDIGNAVYFNFAVGYTFINKFTAEVRLDTNRDFLGHVSGGSNKVISSRIGLNLRYTLN
ncbi:hypothetical protein [Flavobacterium subsaxonicum]|uniref:Outer membrane protein beta-barrel domain-containing protein n=1 Tax=Flavobacterium subsaxonicum WB 4.1-42 = DSM 21790 TaxID=1121898 RepID=A0A0A2MXH9_9FLAO|nr:hypothetical protein [Flavobacterium subsaxonicum]KGO92930.1 hypothetical protein Q766_09870 [Flavobacterium subsaxonicum WB 4.1-42 = DSM 21790]